MSEKVIYNKKTIKSKFSNRLLLKNGLQYTISITVNKKHKFKTIKPFKVKKWIIPNVFLHDFAIRDKAEIKKIIDNDSNEQKSYDRAFALDINEIYELHLTNKQYIKFKAFLHLYEIELNNKFYIQRKGLGLKTIIEYIQIVHIDEEGKD